MAEQNPQATEALPVSPSFQDTLQAENIVRPGLPVNIRIVYLSLLAVGMALVIGVIAQILIWLIAVITNICFNGRFSSAEASPVGNHLGIWVIFIPVIGGLIVGLMARYGSKAIRGHGIPEAMEQVLTNESRIKPAITFLKPLSSAVSIGTGGPFGAEGPIIATGGAFGSVIGQLLRTTADERKILLTAGATAGMSAIFGSPLAAILLAIELLLFEFSPASVIPVSLACFTGAAMHWVLAGTAPFFAMPEVDPATWTALVSYTVLGAFIGVAAAGATRIVYIIEDAFEKLPIHWMWWPALGGVAVGVIGYFAPSTMGVGYDNVKAILSGHAAISVLLVLCFLKFISWALALGSGTSGGTLAPLFTVGGALGALAGILLNSWFPELHIDPKVTALVGMAAIFAGASRALLTSIVFAFETTREPDAVLPLIGACTVAYLVSFFLMRHSIMTEKIERRGVKTPSSLVPDVLDTVTAGEAADTDVHALSAENTIGEIQKWIQTGKEDALQSSFAVVYDDGRLAGILKASRIIHATMPADTSIKALITEKPVTVYKDNPLRMAVDLMLHKNMDMIPVADRAEPQKLAGILTHRDITGAFRPRFSGSRVKERSISVKRGGIKIILKGRKLLERR